MLSFYLLGKILTVHWIFDFILQTNWMAQNKSKSFRALFFHVFVYFGGLCLLGSFPYALINALAHCLIDAGTSRLTSKLWKRGDVHNFFVVIGLDQLLHYLVLFLTATYYL